VAETVISETALEAPHFQSRSSQIFSWSGNTLLKLFHEDIAPDLIRNEEINTTEAFEKGITKVKCYGQATLDGRTGLILEKVEGKTLIALTTSNPGMAFRIPRLMAELQIQMHQTHTDKIRSYRQMVLDALDSEPLSFLTEQEKAAAVSRISRMPDGDSILHLDYHPDNIMSDGKTATIIDWMTAARGVPAADVAATLYLLNEGEMIPGLNRVLAMVLEQVRRHICSKYYSAYKEKTGLTDAEVAQWRLPFLIVRLGVWNIKSEVDLLQRKIRAELNR
jgi:hypothetical protein